MINTKIIKQMFGPADCVKYTLPCKPGDTVLVIAPHPDDETLGCGGIIAQMLQNDITVTVLIMTDGDGGGRMPNIKKIRMHEFECAKTILGFTKDFRLAFPDGSLALYEDEVCEKISEILKKNSFSLIFVPYLLDYNSDHQAVNRVLAKSLIQVDYPLVKIAMYEIWTPITYPNCLINVSLQYEIKKEALCCYRSQESYYGIYEKAIALNALRAKLSMRKQVDYMECFKLLDTENYTEVALSDIFRLEEKRGCF